MRSLTVTWRSVALMVLWLPMCALSGNVRPLVIRAEGSFFVGGERKTVILPGAGPIPEQTGDITVNQMYVQYQIPMKGDRHIPIVMVHGCCLSSKSWETTPDGRMGWSEYFVRRDRSVYLADQVSRGRSGFDPTGFNDVRLGKASPAQMPLIVEPTYRTAWTVFRFGPAFGEVFPDEQFPVQAVDEFYKQLIPDLNSLLPQDPNPTWRQLSVLGTRLRGVVLMGHSESGFFPQHAALINPEGVKGMISIETSCETGLTPTQVATLAHIPTLIVFGDHLGDVTGGPVKGDGPASWVNALRSCRTFVDQVKQAGGDAQVMHLPALGIKGNSHMLMQDRNNIEVADLIIKWIDRHVERRSRH